MIGAFSSTEKSDRKNCVPENACSAKDSLRCKLAESTLHSFESRDFSPGANDLVVVSFSASMALVWLSRMLFVSHDKHE